MAENVAWALEDFVDSLVVELDKGRESLAVRAINKQLTYTVKEVALDVNIFPTYDGDRVTFVTAQPGQEGASKVTISLNSITDQQVRATSKIPARTSDVELEELRVDKSTKKKLRKLGVTSVDDLRNIQQKDVDLRKVSDNEVDYAKLANEIQKARRNDTPPRVRAVSLSRDDDDRPCLMMTGENLAIDPRFPPVAVVNETLADVLSASESELRIRIDENQLAADNEVILTFDPYAVMRVNVRRER